MLPVPLPRPRLTPHFVEVGGVARGFTSTLYIKCIFYMFYLEKPKSKMLSTCNLFLCSSTPPPVWHDQTPNSLNSPYTPQPSSPLSLNSPNAHSSPRGTLKGLGGDTGVHREADSTDLTSLLLGNGGLDHTLIEAMEGLGSLNFRGDNGVAPLLPEKRRGGKLDSCSLSLSGFCSPHSGSRLSIPFSFSMTPDTLRGLSGAPSPGSGKLSSIL